MEVIKKFKNIKSLTEYVQLTEDATKDNNYNTIEFNMSAVLDLKEMRYYEIQYFKNYGKNGIACTIFEQMLSLPASKPWNFLGKEMVLILRFWLKAMKEILLRNQHWWTFMKSLLIFVKDIRRKHESLPNMLVEQLTEYLLNIATQDTTNVCQKFEILHCLNIYCAESSRHIRIELRNKFEKYFVKLSSYMARCAYLPCQFSILETLLRWIIPRSDQVLRSSTAQRWFRKPIFTEEAINIFLERPWLNFFQDARDFLNAHNGTNDIIVSVKFSTMMIGEALTIPEMWLDVNSAEKHICISVLLLPRLLRTLQPTKNDCSEALMIRSEDIQKLTLVRKSLDILLLITMKSPPSIEPSHSKTFDDNVRDVVVNLDPHSDIKRLDSALSAVFGSKYKVNLDFAKEVTSSLQRISQTATKQLSTSVIDERFSQVEVPRRSRVGYVCTRSNQFKNKTLSSTSTSSLLLLRDVADQRNKQFTNKPDKTNNRVSAEPGLSSVPELSVFNGKSKFTAYGVAYSSIWNKNQIDSKTTLKLKQTLLPPVNKADVSCLLVATIGSTDDAVINDTLERVSKNTNYEKNNIVDLLIHEALENTTNEENRPNTTQPNVIEPAENIPMVTFNNRNKQVKRKCTVISRSTTDESHTENIKSPSFINKRKGVFTVNQADVEQCLNKLIERACEQLDKLNNGCNKSMKKKEFDSEDEQPLIRLAKRKIGQTPKNNATMVNKTVNSENSTNQKKKASITNNVNISNITILSPETHIHIFSDSNSSKNKNNQPNRKRKLYSPKFGEMDSEKSKNEAIAKTTTSASQLQSNKITNTTEPTKTFYKDIKTVTKTRIRAQSKRQNRSKQVEPPSPKTELLNKKFDRLKETQDNADDLEYADKNDPNVYNYTSESDDFRENLNERKRNISATGRTTKNKTKSRRICIGKEENTVEKRKIVNKKSKLFKSKLVNNNSDLVDEKMRSAKAVSDTSIILEAPSVVSEVPVIVLQTIPKMELVSDDVNTEAAVKPTPCKRRKINKNYKTVSLKKRELSNKAADRTQSPLPELCVESVPMHQNNTNHVDTDAVIKSLNKEQDNFTADLIPENESKERNINKNISKSIEKNYITTYSTRTSRSALAAVEPIQSVKECDIIMISSKSSTKSTKGNKNAKTSEYFENKLSIKEHCHLVSKSTASQFDRSVSNSMKVYRDSNESPFDTSVNIKTTPRKLDIEGYDAAAKHYYRKVMNDTDDRSGDFSIPEVLESHHNSNGSEETRSKLSGDFEQPRVILEAFNKRLGSDRGSDIREKSIKRNSREPVSVTTMRVDDTAKWLPSSRTSLTNATMKSVTKTSMNKNLHNLNDHANDIEGDEKLRRRPSSPESSCISPNSSSRKKSDKTDDRQSGLSKKSFDSKAITKNASKEKPIAPESNNELVSRIQNIFGKKSASTNKVTIEEVIDISETVNNKDEDSRIETLNNAGTEKVHQCISSPCLFCEWMKKNEAASNIDFSEKSLEELEDTLETVSEYLKKTISETNKKSKEKYAHLFIEILRELDSLENERKGEIAELTKQWDNKYKALKESIKQCSCKVINEDWKLKRGVVKLLQEDVRTVKEYWKSKKQNRGTQ